MSVARSSWRASIFIGPPQTDACSDNRWPIKLSPRDHGFRPATNEHFNHPTTDLMAAKAAAGQRHQGALAKLFARAASCDITPRDGPVQLAGYVSRTTPTSSILDPIEISALLLEASDNRCVIFSFDLLVVGSELQSAVLAKLHHLGFGPDEIVLLASHTHCAPATDRACERLGVADAKFLQHVAEAAEGLVRQMQQMRPSEVSVDIVQGQLRHSINRRRHWPFPTIGRTYGFRLRSVSLAPNPSGPKNEQATVALLRKADDGQVLAVLWHYTCHPTAVVPNNVISSDFPGEVRRAIRGRFGEIPCLFAQGFCGNIRPDIQVSRRMSLRDRFRKVLRTIVSGPSFSSPSPEDWTRWSQSLAAAICAIAQGRPARTFSPASLRTGSASIPIADFFEGSMPAKMLTAQVINIGDEVEILALSAEANVEWERVLDEATPAPSGRVRLHAGYLGALFGYLPTAAQVGEGGYEVDGFQRLFGLSGHFKSDEIGPAVIGCVKRAFQNADRAAKPF